MSKMYSIYETAVNKWGEEPQILMVFEELGELIDAYAKQFRNRNDGTKLACEMSDVKIMLEQLKCIICSQNFTVNIAIHPLHVLDAEDFHYYVFARLGKLLSKVAEYKIGIVKRKEVYKEIVYVEYYIDELIKKYDLRDAYDHCYKYKLNRLKQRLMN